MDDLRGPFWGHLYALTVLETSPLLVKQRALEAQWAVTARLEELVRSTDSEEEKDSLLRASFALERLRESDWAV